MAGGLKTRWVHKPRISVKPEEFKGEGRGRLGALIRTWMKILYVHGGLEPAVLMSMSPAHALIAISSSSTQALPLLRHVNVSWFSHWPDGLTSNRHLEYPYRPLHHDPAAALSA